MSVEHRVNVLAGVLRPGDFAVVRSALAVLLAAIGAGLSAHLLSATPSHDGSARDVVLLAADLIAAALLCGNLRSHWGAFCVIALSSSCVAVGWLFVEDPAHVQTFQIATALVSLIPVLCAVFCGILLFAQAAVLVRVIVELALALVGRAEPNVLQDVDCDRVRLLSEVKDIRLRLFSRRGPPPALAANSTSA